MIDYYSSRQRAGSCFDGQDADREGTQDFNYNGAQFYICVEDSSGLDRTYTVYGEVLRGMVVVDKIVAPRATNSTIR